jgi:O-antigen/teichoic acid export membrane protein
VKSTHAWNAISTIAPKLSGLLTGIIAARGLGAADYGVFSIIYGVIPIVVSFAGVILQSGATRHLSSFAAKKPDPQHIQPCITGIIALGWASALALGALTTAITYTMLPAEHKGLSVFLFIALIAPVITLTLIGCNAALERYSINGKINIIISTCLPLGTYFGAQHGPSGTLIGIGTANLVSLAIINYCRTSSETIHLSLASIRLNNHSKRLLKSTLPAALLTTAYLPIDWWCTLQLIHTPEGENQIAQYNAVKQITGILIIPQAVFCASLLPKLSRRLECGESEMARELTKKCFYSTLLSSLPIFILLLFSHSLFSTIYGDEFTPSNHLLEWSCVSFLILALSGPYGTCLLATATTRFIAWSIGVRSVTLIGLYLILERSAESLAISTAISNAAFFMMHYYGAHMITSKSRSRSQQITDQQQKNNQ